MVKNNKLSLSSDFFHLTVLSDTDTENTVNKNIYSLREAAKKCFFSGPATKRGTVRAFPLKKTKKRTVF